jgi:signal transduction histidine kinase
MKPEFQPITFRRQLITAGVGFSSLVFVAWFDWITGVNLHVGMFYLVPCAVAAWYGGRWPAYFLSVVAVVLWQQFSEPSKDYDLSLSIHSWKANTYLIYHPYVLWNVGVHLIYYPIIMEAVLFLKNTERRLEKMVDTRTAELRGQVIETQRAEGALRKLATQLSEAEGVERRRVAYDIHDSLSQMLGVLKLNLETALIESPTDSRQHERLVDTISVVDNLIRQTRELMFDLHPSMLDDLGLVPTLQGFADEFHRRTMADVTVSESGDRKPIPTPLASYLFRAIKELVNNSVKHGNAAEVVVAVHWIDGSLRVVVDDDGCGFDPGAKLGPNVRRGLGLASIDERMTSLGGKLKLDSQPGQGARAILETPLSVQ